MLIEKILLDIWCIRRPALLMKIRGGHKYFKLRGKMEVNFLDDFVKFVSKSSKMNFLISIFENLLSTDTWLFTNGVNVGIVQLIGQAIRKRKLTKPNDKAVAIGICTYGCVKNINEFQRAEHLETVQQAFVSNNQNIVRRRRSFLRTTDVFFSFSIIEVLQSISTR